MKRLSAGSAADGGIDADQSAADNRALQVFGEAFKSFRVLRKSSSERNRDGGKEGEEQ